MISEVTSNSPSETLILGKGIAKQLKGTELILLKGELGTGKTLLTKGILSYFNIKEADILSPTFTLLNQYKNQEINLFHLDLYRIGGNNLNHLPEIDDNLEEGIIIVEWAQYLHPSYFFLPNVISIIIEYQEENKRKFFLTSNISGFKI